MRWSMRPRHCGAGGPLVHEYWGDNIFSDRTLEGGDIEAAARPPKSSSRANTG